MLPPVTDKLPLNVPPLDSPNNVTFLKALSSPSFYPRCISYCNDLHISVHLSATARGDWRFMMVIYILTVVAKAACDILLPSSRPYFCSLGGFKGGFGFILARYSLGRMLSTTPLGYLSDTLSRASVFVFASLNQCFGNLLYAISPNICILLCLSRNDEDVTDLYGGINFASRTP